MLTKKTAVLIVEDDPQLLRFIMRTLQLEGYAVLTANNGQRALELIEAHVPDLVLLDLTIPKMDGVIVCQRIREFSAVPIIIVTPQRHSRDTLRGLDYGADDFLKKPFSVDELLTRVRAVLRRAQFPTNGRASLLQTPLTIGELTIDNARHLVMMAGREIKLTPIEYSLLAYLAQHAGHIVLQDQLLEHIWGAEYVGESYLLHANINRLRHKLEPDPAHPRYILTKAGIGYLLAAQPEVP